MDTILEGVRTYIDESMNEKLLRPFPYEKVCLDLKTMSPLKFPGKDGL